MALLSGRSLCTISLLSCQFCLLVSSASILEDKLCEKTPPIFYETQTEQAMVEQSLASMCITTRYVLLGYPTLINTCSNQINNQNPIWLLTVQEPCCFIFRAMQAVQKGIFHNSKIWKTLRNDNF